MSSEDRTMPEQPEGRLRPPDTETRVALLESEVDTIKKSLSSIQGDVGKILERVDAARRINWAPVGIFVTVVLGLGGGGIGYYTYTSSQRATDHADRIGDKLSERIAGQSRATELMLQMAAEQRQFWMSEMLEMRKDQDAMRLRMNEIDASARSGNAAAMREVASVKSILTWLQGKFEGEQRLNEWQSEVFRDFEITPKEPNDARP